MFEFLHLSGSIFMMTTARVNQNKGQLVALLFNRWSFILFRRSSISQHNMEDARGRLAAQPLRPSPILPMESYRRAYKPPSLLSKFSKPGALTTTS